MEELFVTENLNISKILEELWAVGTTSVRILDEDFRISLLEEAHHYNYEPEEEVVGSGERLVKQQVLSFKDFPDESDYILLKDSFEELFNRHLEGVGPIPSRHP